MRLWLPLDLEKFPGCLLPVFCVVAVFAGSWACNFWLKRWDARADLQKYEKLESGLSKNVEAMQKELSAVYTASWALKNKRDSMIDSGTATKQDLADIDTIATTLEKSLSRYSDAHTQTWDSNIDVMWFLMEFDLPPKMLREMRKAAWAEEQADSSD